MPTAKRSATPKQNDSKTPEPAPKATRKPSRPRIDAIVNAIVRGDYDDKLKDLRDAIDKRNENRKAQVLALVHEVYGENVSITQPRMPIPLARELATFNVESSEANLDALEARSRSARPNPFVEKALAEGTHYPADESEPEIPTIESSSKSVQVVRGPDDDDLDGDGGVTIVSTGGDGEIISNSPQFS